MKAGFIAAISEKTGLSGWELQAPNAKEKDAGRPVGGAVRNCPINDPAASTR
jgi:hypothetical protein